jgi:putative ABC transport system permease protein
VARIDVEPTRYPADQRVRFAREVIDRLEQLPDIESAGLASFVPLGGESLVRSFHPAGRSDIPGTRPSTFSVGPGYFRTLGIPLVQGREFLAGDDAGAPAVVIANATFVRTYFSGQEALGQTVQTGEEANAQIVGIVGDSRIDTIGEAPKSVLYYAWEQRPRAIVAHARTTRAPEASIPAVERAIAELDRLADVSVATRGEATSLEMNMRRTGTSIVGAIGAVGLLLTLIGLYSVVSYMVLSRSVELGIRMALGATPNRLRWEVLCQTGKLVLAGVAIGTLATVMLAPALATFLAGFSLVDIVAYGGTTFLLLVAALAASFVPARRVLRVDPCRALRQS